MEAIEFGSKIRYWSPAKASGLAVADIPDEHIAALGGLRQRRVRGRIAGIEFASNIMPAGGGRLALTVSKAMMRAAGATIGDRVDIELTVLESERMF
jgi:hypothetical protein